MVIYESSQKNSQPVSYIGNQIIQNWKNFLNRVKLRCEFLVKLKFYLTCNFTMTNESEWTQEGDALQKTYTFETFEKAMEFMMRATPHISRFDHHPEWTNLYNRVHVRLTTHDAGGVVTRRDHQLAELLDTLCRP